MRPSTSPIDDRAALADYVEDRANRIDGRLGVLIGYPTGPTPTDFEAVVSRRADRPYPSASVIKLPILYALYRRHDPALDGLDEPRSIAPENHVGGAGLFYLLDAPEPSLRDLARATITISDNAATNELIDYLGLEAVNEAAADLGMGDTHLGRKMMATLEPDGARESGSDDEDDGSSTDPVNTTSPRDCARLFADLCQGTRLSAAARTEQLGILRNQKDSSMVSRYFPYDCTVAHKTGWLPGAALDTGLIEPDDGEPLFFAAFCDWPSNGGEATDVLAEVGAATLAWLKDRG